MKRALSIRVAGTVQGVGFRPFVYRTAVKFRLQGYVTNLEDATVEIVVEGKEEDIKGFIRALKEDAPKVAMVQEVRTDWGNYSGRFRKFEIKKSQRKRVLLGFMIPPDIGLCSECKSDIVNHGRRWYRYPFTCCAQCGPRFTAVYESPYDRIRTNMRDFPLCKRCRGEYENPADRRFHAQGICCPTCGPSMALYTADGDKVKTKDPFREAARLLDEGYVVAIKGIGGIHLATKTTEDKCVERLRKKRNRPYQPFAVMSPNIETVKTYAIVGIEEEKLLTSWQKPILLLTKSPAYYLSDLISPGLDTIGVMLPYTGIHFLLFQFVREPALVMTSGNDPGIPMAISSNEAFKTIGKMTDYFLLHNREIVNRCDDSVIRVINGTPTFLRRSRGYVPSPIKVPTPNEEVTAIAVGAELRNAGAIIYRGNAYLTQHIGDADNLETRDHLDQSLKHLSQLLEIKGNPDVIACDMHPRYVTSRLAHEISQEKGVKLVKIQHHHAHITALMAENMIPPDQPIIGISMDGVGYGPDGTIWGGEILETTYSTYVRLGHLRLQPMPGGDLCTYYPVRMLVSILGTVLSEKEVRDITARHAKYGLKHGLSELHAIINQIKNPLIPQTTSSGRFLDAVSAAMGLCYKRTYEGEPAMKLEAAADQGDASKVKLAPQIIKKGDSYEMDTSQLLSDIAALRYHHVPDVCAAAQHAFAIGMAEMAVQIAMDRGISTVGISGGVAVNVQITRDIEYHIRNHGLHVIRHSKVPPGDGGVSLGQGVSALYLV